jgi:hypothetical protein
MIALDADLTSIQAISQVSSACRRCPLADVVCSLPSDKQKSAHYVEQLSRSLADYSRTYSAVLA